MTYTLSADFFKGIGSEVFTDILFPFTNSQRPNVKMAVDNGGIILERYRETIDTSYIDIFNMWLYLMTTHKDTSFSTVMVDLSNTPKDEYCLTIASTIKGQRKLIVNSIQSVTFLICDDNCVDYHGEHIPVIERCYARQEVNSQDDGTRIIVNGSKDVRINNNSNNQ